MSAFVRSPIVQTVMSPAADPGVVSSIQAFVEIDPEIISFHCVKKCCCQLQGKVCAQSTG